MRAASLVEAAAALMLAASPLQANWLLARSAVASPVHLLLAIETHSRNPSAGACLFLERGRGS
jgi:hypothetical protein